MRLWKRPFRPDDLQALELQHVQRGELELIGEPLALCDGGDAWTMIAGEPGGRHAVRACGGVLYSTRWRAKAWSLIGSGLTRREWGYLSLAMDARLTELQLKGLRRVEAETRLDFTGGHRFLLHLGFKFEGTQHGAAHDGAPLALFARVRDRVMPQELVRYEAVRSLGYAMLIEDVLLKRYDRRAA